MRLIPLLFAAAAAGCSSGTPDSAWDRAKAAKLAAGDPAPPLPPVEWLNGAGFTAFQPGTAYVLDFWATWCGPCLEMMPHLAELNRTYAGQNLVVAPITTLTDRNPRGAVEGYVNRVGPGYGLAFAVCPTMAAEEGFLQAAGRNSLPTTFVVDKQGKIAFIGHPAELADVLPKVLAGTWDPATDPARLAAMQAALEVAGELAEKSPRQAAAAFARFDADFPEKAKQPAVRVTKFNVLVLAGEFDAAAEVGRGVFPDLVAAKDGRLLRLMAGMLADAKANPAGRHLDFADQAAAAALAAGPADVPALVTAADVAHRRGDGPGARGFAGRALAAAKSDKERAAVEKRVGKY